MIFSLGFKNVTDKTGSATANTDILVSFTSTGIDFLSEYIKLRKLFQKWAGAKKDPSV